MKTETLDLLRKFCTSERTGLSAPFNSYTYRGEHHINHDVCATNGQVLLCVREVKHPDLKEETVGFPAEWWWAMDAIASREPEVKPAAKAAVERIPSYVHEQLKAVPSVEFLSVPKVRVTVSGRTTRERWAKIDQNGVVFFRWDGGEGLCVAAKTTKAGKDSE